MTKDFPKLEKSKDLIEKILNEVDGTLQKFKVEDLSKDVDEISFQGTMEHFIYNWLLILRAVWSINS